MSLKNKMYKILFVSRWYPNRLDAMEGLFVRKHALASNLYSEVQVLFVKEDNSIKKTEMEFSVVSGLRETIVYYPFSKYRLIRALRYFYALFKGYQQVKRSRFVPQLLHVNVLTRVGFFAYLVKIFDRVPYVVSEHWSRYFEQGYYRKTSLLHKSLTKFIVNNSSYLLPVSNILNKALEKCDLRNKNTQIVHNTIDDFFWNFPKQEKTPTKRILHVSCFDEKAKNIKGIIRTFLSLYQKRKDIELVIVGTGPDFESVKSFSAIQKNVPIYFIGEQKPTDVAQFFSRSDVFVLFSNYETSGVVLMESLAAGTPIVSTPCGIAPEIVTNKNGMIVPFADEKCLEEKIDWVLNNPAVFNEKEIRKTAEQFRFLKVGKQLEGIYCKVIEG